MNLPEDVKKILDALNGGGYASCAIRFAAGFEGIIRALSGMSEEPVMDKAAYMKDFRPLGEEEQEALKQVVELFRSRNLIACIGCRCCADGCPMNIDIPKLFAYLNAKKLYDGAITDHYSSAADRGKTSRCIGCGECEKSCPQLLEIRRLLEEAAAEFEKE